jgi:hypothetical protein
MVEQQDYSTVFSMLQRLPYTLFVLLFLVVTEQDRLIAHVIRETQIGAALLPEVVSSVGRD